MKRLGMVFMLLAVLCFGVMAENGITFASDSTYVATITNSSLGFVANPNASATIKFAPFTFVSTGNASYDFTTMKFTAINVSEKLDFTYGVFNAYVKPTVDLLNNNVLTLPSAFALSKVVPFTTVTVASDIMGFTKNAWSVSVTAEMVF